MAEPRERRDERYGTAPRRPERPRLFRVRYDRYAKRVSQFFERRHERRNALVG
jgi:hypothetical protein